MSPEELTDWLLERPLFMGYVILLFAGSLAAFLSLTYRIYRRGGLKGRHVSAWPLQPLDFGLFLVALILWFVLSGSFLLQAHRLVTGEEAAPTSTIIVLGGLLLQGGMLYIFLRFRFHFRSPNEGPLSPRLMSPLASLLHGAFYFLAALPVIYGVGFVWAGFLNELQRQGFEINLPPQDAVLLFQETRESWVFFSLLGLAVIVAPLVEELVFRGGIFRYLKGRFSMPAAILISALLFGAVHGNLQSFPGLVAVGICLAIAYELSGNIKIPIVFHALFNLNSVLWILLLPPELVQ
jgi:membrane protease YdiL (CAAX protease family)